MLLKKKSLLRPLMAATLMTVLFFTSCFFAFANENSAVKPVVKSVSVLPAHAVINQPIQATVATDLSTTKLKISTDSGKTYFIADIDGGYSDYVDTADSRIWTVTKAAQTLGDCKVYAYAGNYASYSAESITAGYKVYKNILALPENSAITTTMPAQPTVATTNEATYLPKLDSAKINVLDKDRLIKGYIGYQGEIIPHDDYSVTDYIPIKPGETYTLPASGDRALAYYTADKKLIERVQIDMGVGSVYTFTVPNNAAIAYMKIQFGYKNVNGFDPNSAMICSGGVYYTEYVPYGINFDWVNSSNLRANKLYAKKVAWIGDSIFAATGAQGAMEKIALRNSMPYENCACNGSTISRTPGTVTCVDLMKNLPSDAEYILIEGGLNDAWGRYPLGTYNASFTAAFDEKTFYGALDKIFHDVSIKFAGKKIGVVISHKVQKVPSWSEYSAAMKQMCNKYSLPYLDLYETSGLCGEIDELNQLYFLDGDRTHPNDLGYEMLADKIEAFMLGL